MQIFNVTLSYDLTYNRLFLFALTSAMNNTWAMHLHISQRDDALTICTY